MQFAAFRFRDQSAGDLFHRTDRERQPLRRGGEAGGIGHGGHFDPRLGAVEERIEHLRAEAAFFRPFQGQAVMPPHRFRGRGMEFRHIQRALAGGHDIGLGLSDGSRFART